MQLRELMFDPFFLTFFGPRNESEGVIYMRVHISVYSYGRCIFWVGIR
jgi:hypothetical protein